MKKYFDLSYNSSVFSERKLNKTKGSHPKQQHLHVGHLMFRISRSCTFAVLAAILAFIWFNGQDQDIYTEIK